MRSVRPRCKGFCQVKSAGSSGRQTALHCVGIRLKRMMIKPFQTQIPSRRIYRHNQCNLLDAQPPLDLFLAFNRFMHIFVPLEVHKPIKFVSARELGSHRKSMAPHSPNEIPGYPRVQSLRAIRHDVDEVSLRLAHNAFSLNAKQH